MRSIPFLMVAVWLGTAAVAASPAPAADRSGAPETAEEARPAHSSGKAVTAVVERLERNGFKRWTTDGQVDFLNVVAFAVTGPRDLPNLVSAFTPGHPTVGDRPLLLGDRVTFVLPADYDDRILAFSQLQGLRLADE